MFEIEKRSNQSYAVIDTVRSKVISVFRTRKQADQVQEALEIAYKRGCSEATPPVISPHYVFMRGR